MNTRFLGCTVILLSTAVMSHAQPGWNWPEDKAAAEEKNVMYSDSQRAGQFQQAAEHLQWLLDNAPDLNESIYINGIKIYQELAESESDPAKKRAHQEKCLGLYDLRIDYFGNENKVLNRKAYTAYKFYKNDKQKYAELFQLYERTFELNGNNVSTNNLVAYMDVIRRYKLTGGQITDDEILERYENVMAIIDHKLKSGKNTASLQKNKEFVDKLLTTMVQVDCEFVSDKLGPKLKEDPSNIKLAKKIMGLSLANKCTEKPIFLVASIIVQEQEPAFGISKVIALKSDAAGDYATADKYYAQAVELADDNTKKGEILYAHAASQYKRGRKPTARQYALEAAAADPSLKMAYKLVGDLYYNSFNDCKAGVSRVQDRAVYFAAYEMYRQAGNAKMMQSAKEQFPSIDDIFELDLKEGQTIKVGCWINKSVPIQRRPT